MPNPSFSTASTILTQARAETGIGSSPVSTAHQDTAMLRALNDINHEFVNFPYAIGMLGWKFMLAETIIQTQVATALNGAVSKNATSIIVDDASIWDDPATATLEAGYIKTGNSTYDYFAFEDISSNTLSTISSTDIQLAHSDDEEVHKIYKLPTNFGKIRGVFRESNDYPYEYVDPDFSQTPKGNQFTIRRLSSTNYSAEFMVFREDIGSIEFKVQYLKAPTSITAITDTVDAPDGTARRFLIEALKEYIWSAIGEENDAQISRQKAEREMQKTLSEWSVSHVLPSQNLVLNW